VESLFIVPSGKPLGILFQLINIVEFSYFTTLVPKFVKRKFPDKHITPQDFRRMIPSAIYRYDIHKEGENVTHTLTSLAQLMNTSDKVIVTVV
jgi:hypothetical protein